jgi:hypothetical protein
MCKCYTFTIGNENGLQVQLRISGFNLAIFDVASTFPKAKFKN